ncbi:hypothetical protein MVI01_31630 [Myxococcus virescens]|uniref:Uncharacterized protein n=1 Tax=Myxococcus virescens TaxID=83456 RepID=A0A511HFG5_9BACT|nr:hypothetical protein MVI01_31630 [Myxococcus virescens]
MDDIQVDACEVVGGDEPVIAVDFVGNDLSVGAHGRDGILRPPGMSPAVLHPGSSTVRRARQGQATTTSSTWVRQRIRE